MEGGEQRHLNSTRPEQEGRYIIAVLEGRGVSREVGMAALEKDTGVVNIVQVKLLDLSVFALNGDCMT
jgi:hypothetical protein